MNIAVVGAGSLGLLFAGKLISVIPTVRLLTHGPVQADAINADGLEVAEKENAVVVHCSASAFADWPRAWSDFTPDWVFLAVKQRDIDEPFVRKIGELLGANGKLLCFQNGIGHLQRLSAYVANDRIYLAVTTEAAKKHSDRRVVHTGRGATWIGPAGDGVLSGGVQAEVQELVELLANAGFTSFAAEDMAPHVWQKLLINAVINPLTAVLGVSNGELLRTSHSRQLMRVLLEEGVALARAVGVEIAGDLWERLTDVCRRTAENDSSMLQDMKQKRPTEIDAINGSMIRLARERGMELFTHEALYLLIKAREGDGYEEKEDWQ